MINKKILGLLLLMTANMAWAQLENPNSNEGQDSVSTILVNPFDRQSVLGQAFYMFLLDFEKSGHFAEEGDYYATDKLVSFFTSQFDSSAIIANDLSNDTAIGTPVSIKEYAKLAKKHNYKAYRLILEKKTISATSVSEGRFAGTYRFFKLYSDRAIIGEAYQYGAIYEMNFEFDENGENILIHSLTVEPDGEFRKFKLGNFGYFADFHLMVSNDLSSLVLDPSLLQLDQLKPPKDSADYRAQPTFSLSGSYILPSYLWATNYANNLNSDAGSSTTQGGWAMGLRAALPLGKKGNLNFIFGLEYEENTYEVAYNDLQFVYKTDCFGEPLTDLEGTPYDEKWVDVSSSKEKGSLSYIKPELGLLYKISLGKKLELNLMAAAGFSYLTSSEFNSESTVSYTGKKYGFGDPISQEELGFYTDYKKNSFGDISNASSFYYYKFGGSIDYAISQTSTLSFGFEMRNGLSPVFETGYEFCPFLDPDLNDTFLSSFTNVEDPVTYQSMAFVLSYKYQFKKK